MMFLQDNSVKKIKDTEISEADKKLLSVLADKSVTSLIPKSGNSLVVMSTLKDKTRKSILNERILSLSKKDDAICVHTTNIVGFIGQGDSVLTIGSRFSSADGTDDYFLHYLLSKVFGFTLIDFEHQGKRSSWLNLLLLLFPCFFNAALQQGLYKKYRNRQYNDARPQGSIDIPRHLKTNIPPNGKIAYRLREMSCDNEVTELIRHTVEYIKSQTLGRKILSRDSITKANVQALVNATAGYKSKARLKVIKANQRALNHPFFTKYAALQQLCLAILRYESLQYGNYGGGCYGLIIDMAWLWEEYLATLLTPLDFAHPDNRERTGGKYFLAAVGEDNSEAAERFNNCMRYPDFYRQGKKDGQTIIIDAKYKDYLNENNSLDRNDGNQILAYLYGMKGKYAVILCPVAADAVYRNKAYALSGWGRENNAKLYVICFKVKEGFTDADDCRIFMEKSEQDLIDHIREFIDKAET